MRALIFSLFMIAVQVAFAQLYINGDLTIQNGASLYADDTITIDPQATVAVSGLLHNTRIIYTNFNYINTGTTGYVITTIPNGITKEIGIGTTTNSRVGIAHGNGSPVAFKLAVRDSIHVNPVTSANTITTKAVSKTWYVEPLANAANTTITPGWNSPDELAAFDRTDCAVSYWQNGTSTAWTIASPFSASSFTGIHPEFIRLASPVNLNAGVYYFGIGSPGSTLPVKFIAVDAIALTDGNNLVKWQVANLLNGNYFEVERSANGKTFEAIGRVTIIRNAAAADYSFIDAAAGNGISYYRIKQVDFDHSVTLSKIVRVAHTGKATGVVLYPNPATENFCIYNTAQQADLPVTIYNNIGVPVMHTSRYEGNINVTGLNKGIYYVQYGTEVIRLVVQ